MCDDDVLIEAVANYRWAYNHVGHTVIFIPTNSDSQIEEFNVLQTKVLVHVRFLYTYFYNGKFSIYFGTYMYWKILYFMFKTFNKNKTLI